MIHYSDKNCASALLILKLCHTARANPKGDCSGLEILSLLFFLRLVVLHLCKRGASLWLYRMYISGSTSCRESAIWHFKEIVCPHPTYYYFLVAVQISMTFILEGPTYCSYCECVLLLNIHDILPLDLKLPTRNCSLTAWTQVYIYCRSTCQSDRITCHWPQNHWLRIHMLSMIWSVFNY